MFDVIWSPPTVDELAQIWVDAGGAVRQRITAAVSAIDQVLRRRASQIGESRDDEEFRIYFESPLGIEFRVSEEHRVAVIARVWRYSVQDRSRMLHRCTRNERRVSSVRHGAETVS